jgi:hypothetical protein
MEQLRYDSKTGQHVVAKPPMSLGMFLGCIFGAIVGVTVLINLGTSMPSSTMEEPANEAAVTQPEAVKQAVKQADTGPARYRPTKHSERGPLGCRTREDMDKLLGMVLAKDNTASYQLYLQGRCDFMGDGEFYVVESPIFSDNFCVRKAGHPDCVWTNKGWLTKD